MTPRCEHCRYSTYRDGESMNCTRTFTGGPLVKRFMIVERGDNRGKFEREPGSDDNHSEVIL